jgi:hypothetical protein
MDIDGFDGDMFIAGGVNSLLDVSALSFSQNLPQFELLSTNVELVLSQLKTRIRYFYIVVFEKYVTFRSSISYFYISQENDSNIMSSSIYKLLNNIYILYITH